MGPRNEIGQAIRLAFDEPKSLDHIGLQHSPVVASFSQLKPKRAVPGWAAETESASLDSEKQWLSLHSIDFHFDCLTSMV